jgi:homogentisate phytyltransferase / homogentisate geranylgeranyltransferase
MTPPPEAAVAVRARRPRAGALARGAGVLWRFARPHTIIGTTLSVAGLYVVAASELPGIGLAGSDGLFQLACTLLAALCVNVFIVGVNELTDVEIDRINKPYLPLAAGDLSRRGAIAIVATAAVVPAAMAVTQGVLEVGAVLAGLAIGAAYSLPPLRLKRFPTAASLSISLVRALVVNLGVYAHFTRALAPTGSIAGPVWALTLFVLPFSFAIAILKDVPDIEGDRRYRITTFSVRFGAEHVVRLALGVLTVAYLAMATLGAVLLETVSAPVLIATHLLGLGLLWRWRAGVDIHDRVAFTGFYMAVWKLFFLEYVFVALACVAR